MCARVFLASASVLQMIFGRIINVIDIHANGLIEGKEDKNEEK